MLQLGFQKAGWSHQVETGPNSNASTERRHYSGTIQERIEPNIINLNKIYSVLRGMHMIIRIIIFYLVFHFNHFSRLIYFLY